MRQLHQTAHYIIISSLLLTVAIVSLPNQPQAVATKIEERDGAFLSLIDSRRHRRARRKRERDRQRKREQIANAVQNDLKSGLSEAETLLKSLVSDSSDKNSAESTAHALRWIDSVHSLRAARKAETDAPSASPSQAKRSAKGQGPNEASDASLLGELPRIKEVLETIESLPETKDAMEEASARGSFNTLAVVQLLVKAEANQRGQFRLCPEVSEAKTKEERWDAMRTCIANEIKRIQTELQKLEAQGRELDEDQSIQDAVGQRSQRTVKALWLYDRLLTLESVLKGDPLIPAT